jgi:hypothetical protein
MQIWHLEAMSVSSYIEFQLNSYKHDKTIAARRIFGCAIRVGAGAGIGRNMRAMRPHMSSMNRIVSGSVLSAGPEFSAKEVG